ncbi:MAG TPA: SPW repeat protein [Pseudonocardiaceae bacterium]|nr:SPW repeat protein [Pseudonocardiaceae bacterium]
MKRWTRWQDWAAVVLGVIAVLSVLRLETSRAAMWSLLAFGLLLIASGLWSLAMPGSVASEYVHIGLGVLLFISPWVLGYLSLAPAAWTSWALGVLVVVAGAAAVPVALSAHRGVAGQH